MTSTGSPSRRTLLGSALASGAVVTAGLQLSGSAAAAGTGHPEDQPGEQPATAAASSRSGGRVVTGAEVAAANDWAVLRGSKLGMISNPTGIMPDARHSGRPLPRPASCDRRRVRARARFPRQRAGRWQ